MLEVGRIVPVYESLGGTTAWGAKLTSKWLRRVIWTLFEELEERFERLQQLRYGCEAGETHADGRRCRSVAEAEVAGAAGGAEGGAFS